MMLAARSLLILQSMAPPLLVVSLSLQRHVGGDSAGSVARQRGCWGSTTLSRSMPRRHSQTRPVSTTTNFNMISTLWDEDSVQDHSERQEDNNDNHSRRQSVAVIGSGAVGCYYGGRLAQAGHDVQFYLRPSANFDAVQQKGLQVKSIDGDFDIPPDDLQLFDCTANMRPRPDWILIALKSTAMSAIPDLIVPLLSKKTKILVLMNGLVDEDMIRLLREATGQQTDNNEDEKDDDNAEPLLCCRTLYGGLAFVAANRVAPGEIHHVYAGPIAAGVASTVVSHDTARTELQALFQKVDMVPCNWEDSLRVGRWRKMLWNLPFNGVSVAMGGIPTDQIVTDPGLRELALRVMQETRQVALADCGSDDALPASLIDSMFDLTDSMGEYRPSTMIDLIERRPMEVEYLFRKPLQRGQALGVETPYIWTIVTMIEALQRKHNLF